MGVMHVMGPEGDIVVEWDADDQASVDKAKAEWARLKKDGFEFFQPVEAKGKLLTRFDKKLGRVIAAPGVKKPVERVTGKRSRAMAGGPVERVEGDHPGRYTRELDEALRLYGHTRGPVRSALTGLLP